MRGVLQPSPRGPCGLGPVLDLARPTTARFNPPSRPPGTHPDSQDLPAASAHPGWALPRAAPCIPLASHRCCPLKPPAAPSRQLCGVGAGHSHQHCEEPGGQTDLSTHCHPSWVPQLKERPELPSLPAPASPGLRPRLPGTGWADTEELSQASTLASKCVSSQEPQGSPDAEKQAPRGHPVIRAAPPVLPSFPHMPLIPGAMGSLPQKTPHRGAPGSEGRGAQLVTSPACPPVRLILGPVSCS